MPVWAAPETAAPDPTHAVHLDYDAPEGCGAKSEVLAKLREALGANTRDVREITAHVAVTVDASRYVLRYEATSGEAVSRRTLNLDACDAVSEAAAVLLLLTLDPTLVSTLDAQSVNASDAKRESPEASSAAPVAASVAPAVLPPRDRFLKRAPRDRTPAPMKRTALLVDGGWIAVGGGFVSALAPRSSFGINLELGASIEPLQVALHGAWSKAPDQAIEQVPGASLSSWLLRLHVGAALALSERPFRFGPYASFGTEWLTAEARGISEPQSASTPLLSATGGVWFRADVAERLGVVARAGALFPLERPTISVRGVDGILHQPAALGTEAFIGVLWTLGSQK